MKIPSTTFAALAVSTLAFLTAPAQAATKTFTGGVDGTGPSWNTSANWDPVNTPQSGDEVLFNGVSVTNSTFFGGNSRTIRGLTFDQAASMTVSLSNSANGGGAARILTLTSAAATDISVLQGSHTIQGANTTTDGNLTFNDGDQVWDIAAASTLTLDTRLASQSNTGVTYTKKGNGIVTLSRSNGGSGGWIFTAPFSIEAGTVKLAANSASGNSANSWTVASGATLELAQASAFSSGGGTLTLNGNGFGGVGALHASASSTLNASTGSVLLASDATVGVDDSVTLTIGNGIAGTGDLTKIGDGQLTFSGANNTYTGNTLVNAGSLLLDAGGVMTFDIGASGINNQITGSGAVTLDGVFHFNLAGGHTAGDSWLIVDVDGLGSVTFGDGTFSVDGFTKDGDLWTVGNYQFSEETGVLQVIPEPGSLSLLCGVAGLVLARAIRRRQRK